MPGSLFWGRGGRRPGSSRGRGGWGCPGHPGPFLRGGGGGELLPVHGSSVSGSPSLPGPGARAAGGGSRGSPGELCPPTPPWDGLCHQPHFTPPPHPSVSPLTPLNPPTPPPAPAHPSAAGSRSAPPPPEARKRGGDKGEGAWRWAGLLRERGVAFSGAWLLRGGSVAVAGKRRGFCGEREALALWGKGRGYEGSPAPAPPGLAAPYLTPVTDPGGGTGRSGEGFGRGGVSLGSLRGGGVSWGGPDIGGGDTNVSGGG